MASDAAHAMVQQVAEDISARRLKWLQNTVGFSNAQAASDLTQALGNLSQSRYATLPQGHYLRVVKPAESDGQVEQAAAAK